jgi:chromate transporter
VDTVRTRGPRAALEVLAESLRLGLTSFGGPVAHLGYFHDRFVRVRGWVSDEGFADIVALCQSLPGPASSQVNMAIGMSRAGIPGAVAAWVGFTLPSAAAMTGAALLFGTALPTGSGWMHGLLLAAVAVVAQAVVGMARRLPPDPARAVLAIGAAILCLLLPYPLAQPCIIVAAGIIGRLFLPRRDTPGSGGLPLSIPRPLSIASLALFVVLLAGLPVARGLVHAQWLSIAEGFYRTGSLVFGGGHVVLPLLRAEVVPAGWLSDEGFMAGYGAAQAMPGPLFTFAAFLGASSGLPPVAGALLALGAIFLPSFLLLVGILPFWAGLRSRPGVQTALAGVNASVVGLLGAALYQPVWTGAVHTAADVGIALGCWGLLSFLKAPPWCVVIVGAAAGAAARLLS